MNNRNKMRKMAQDAVTKAADAVTQANRALGEAQAALRMMEELSDDDLNMVAGGVNPFGDDDRVPDNPIDPDLREKG